MALTEIVAKAAGLSVTDLWGDRSRETVPVYASFQSYTDREDWLRHSLYLAERAVTYGFRQIKVKIGGKSPEADQEHILALLEMTERKVQVALDANQSYDLAVVRRWHRLLEEWPNIAWLEEPLPMDPAFVRDYRTLRETLPVPVAGGENVTGARTFLPFLTGQSLDIIQPYVSHVDGVDGFRTVQEMARAFGVRVSPHAYDGPLSRLYAIFAQSCLSPWSKMSGESIEPVEWDAMENPFTDLLPIPLSEGRVTVPSGPGIGVEPDWDIIRAYRWDGSVYR